MPTLFILPLYIATDADRHSPSCGSEAASKKIDAIATVGMNANMREWFCDLVLKLCSSCLLANTGS